MAPDGNDKEPSTPEPIKEGSIGLASAPDPSLVQHTLFTIPDLVSEIVGYLSSRQDIVKCLYISKRFYRAALPLVYKYIPLRHLDMVNPELKERYLRTVVAPRSFLYNPDNELPEDGPNLFIEGDFNKSRNTTLGSMIISGSKAHRVWHLSSSFLDDTENVPETPETDSTLTIVLVPPYITGEKKCRGQVLSDFLRLAINAGRFLNRVVTIVGLEHADPFTEDTNIWATRNQFDKTCKICFQQAVERMPPPRSEARGHALQVHKERIRSGLRFRTFKDYIESTSTWRDTLNWRMVGQWLNKYYEREAELSLATAEPTVEYQEEVDLGDDFSELLARIIERCSLGRGSPSPTMDHLPRALPKSEYPIATTTITNKGGNVVET